MSITASAVISSTPDGSNYNYTIQLTNSSVSTEGIGLFAYAWAESGQDYLATKPLSITAPANWTGTPMGGGSGDGYSIQFVADNTTSDLLSPGESLSFSFTSADTPSSVYGNSIFYPGTPVGTSFVTGTTSSTDTFVVTSPVVASPTPTPTPEPTPSPTPAPTPTPSPTPAATPTPSSTRTPTPISTGPTTPLPATPPRPAPKVRSASPSSQPLATRTVLSIKPRSTALGEPVILTAGVADLSHPHGTVAFMAGGTRLGTADLQAGTATLTTTALPAGRPRVRVVYLGTTDFRQSRSAIWIERVGASRSDAPPADQSRNIAAIAGTTSRVPLLRRPAVVNARSDAQMSASPDLAP
jgi:hypothetical protein